MDGRNKLQEGIKIINKALNGFHVEKLKREEHAEILVFFFGSGFVKVKLSRYGHAVDKGKKIYSSQSFLTLPDGGDGQRHAPAVLYSPKRILGNHSIGIWVGLRASLGTDATGKNLCLCRELNPGRSVCTQTLHRLSYHSSVLNLLLPFIRRKTGMIISKSRGLILHTLYGCET
jgi:hypothetical protein